MPDLLSPEEVTKLQDYWSAANYLTVGPQFFETMKIAVRQGRGFNAADYELTAKAEADKKIRAAAVEPVMVTEAFVRAYFPKVNPLGQPFGAYVPGVNGDPSPDETVSAGWQIVGVVRDAKYESLRVSIAPTIYAPASDGGSFELRTSRDPATVEPDVRNILRQAGKDIPVENMQTQTETIERQLFQERLVARLASMFGVLALLLAAVGLYGLLAHEVTRGTRARHRHSCGAGSADGTGTRWGGTAGRRAGCIWAGDRRGRVAGRDASDGDYAFRDQAWRSNYVGGREPPADARSAGGLLHSRSPGKPARSTCGIAPPITVVQPTSKLFPSRLGAATVPRRQTPETSTYNQIPPNGLS